VPLQPVHDGVERYREEGGNQDPHQDALRLDHQRNGQHRQEDHADDLG